MPVQLVRHGAVRRVARGLLLALIVALFSCNGLVDMVTVQGAVGSGRG